MFPEYLYLSLYYQLRSHAPRGARTVGHCRMPGISNAGDRLHRTRDPCVNRKALEIPTSSRIGMWLPSHCLRLGSFRLLQRICGQNRKRKEQPGLSRLACNDFAQRSKSENLGNSTR